MYRNVDMTTAEMLKLHEEGYTNPEIAEIAGCSPWCVWDRIGTGNRSKKKRGTAHPRQEKVEITRPKNKKEVFDILPTRETFVVSKGKAGRVEIAVDYADRKVRFGNIMMFADGLSFDEIPDLLKAIAFVLRTRIEPRMAKTEGEENGEEETENQY